MRKSGIFCCVAYVESESGVLPLNYAPSTADYKAFLFSMQAES